MSTLTVTARNPGHYGDKHRRPGELFTLADRADFASSWMAAEGWDPQAQPEPAADTPPEPKPAKPKAKTETTNPET